MIIDKNVMKGIRECIPLAPPLHNPANITGIEACKEVMPNTPMVAVFDTAFHQTMPPKAYIYAVPYRWYTENKVRRYGFHGTSHQYVTERAAALLGRPIEELRIASLPPGQRCFHLLCEVRQVHRHLHGLHSPGRPAHGHPCRRHRRRPSWTTSWTSGATPPSAWRAP